MHDPTKHYEANLASKTSTLLGSLMKKLLNWMEQWTVKFTDFGKSFFGEDFTISSLVYEEKTIRHRNILRKIEFSAQAVNVSSPPKKKKDNNNNE